MDYELVISQELWHRLRSHVLADEDEHLAFLLAQPAGSKLLARDLLLVPDEALEGGTWGGLSLQLSTLLAIMNAANQRQLALIEAHSHPQSDGWVQFSPIDLEGQRDFAAYYADVAPERPYGALVFGQRAVQGRVWVAGTRLPAELRQIKVVGPVLECWPGDGMALGDAGWPLEGHDLYARQVLALGPEGQRRLQHATVAIVGLGGIGSIVAQELAHLGVGSLILVDDDVVEQSNLHRLVGAVPGVVGQPKVLVSKALIEQVNPRARIQAIQRNVRDVTALGAVKGADVIIGCVDTDAGRLILNELALAHLVPYIDCGVGITVTADRITEAGGRVVVWVPDRPCLLCAQEIDVGIAGQELESEEELAFRRRQGYVLGATVPEPAVISLNGTVASLATTELLALVTGFRQTSHYLYYDLLEQRAGHRVVKRAPGCVACASEGLGDQADLERYGRRGLPRDLPA